MTGANGDPALDRLYAALDALVDHARNHLGLDPRDGDWARNGILGRYGLASYRPTGAVCGGI